MKSVLREPLVHFLALGALLFLFFEWRGGSGPGSSRIAITPGLIEHLTSGFARTWQRPPTDAEIKGLIDDYVKEEIATREALGMGLDRDDTIIRRRLRQKLEFLVEDAVSSSAPTDAELQAGSAMSAAKLGALGLFGIVATLFAFVALAAALVVALRAPWARIAVRVAGSWIVAIGLLLLGWSLRPA